MDIKRAQLVDIGENGDRRAYAAKHAYEMYRHCQKVSLPHWSELSKGEQDTWLHVVKEAELALPTPLVIDMEISMRTSSEGRGTRFRICEDITDEGIERTLTRLRDALFLMRTNENGYPEKR